MKSSLLILFLLALPFGALSQQAVSGRVVSAADNMPLPGASVQVKGTDKGTTADAEGNFTLPALVEKTVLQVHFLGYTAREMEISFPLPQPILIALEENEYKLQEVVVSTGYQQVPQERATGSFARVSQERLNEQVSTDVLGRLEAMTNGLTVDRGTGSRGRIMVRGLSTIMGPRDPLFIVDNFPYEGDISNINPNDVESITILKDAAAASIWGARAGNGVIVITTKKGRFNQPLQVEFNTNVTVSDKPDLSYIPQMSSSDFIDMEQALFDRGYYNSNINSVNKPALTPVVELLLQHRNGGLSEAALNARLDALRQVDVRDEFDRHMYRRGVNQQYSLGLRGGSASNAWLLSLGYDRNLNNLASTYDRMNLNLQNTLRPLKNLELSTGLYYTQSGNTSGRPGYGEVTMSSGYFYPYAQFADAEGNPLPHVKDYRQSWKEIAGEGKLLDWNYYPLEDHTHSRTESTGQEVLGNFGLRYQLPFGLAADLKYQYQQQQSKSEQLHDAASYHARNQTNLYTRIDPETGAVTYGIPVGGILNRSSNLVASHNARGQLNFNRDWGHHSMTAIAGAELREVQATGNSSRLYGFDENNLTFGQVDHTNPHPLLTNGRDSFILPGDGIQSTLNRYVSIYSNTAYTFRNRYTVSASARRDASNLFGVNANDRWNPLWSSGLSWNVSEEKFYGLTLLPLLKLRATYGFSGNVDQGRTAVTTMEYRFNLSPFTGAPMAIFSNYANPELRWETSRMTNIGLDFGFRGSRLTGSLEYFRKKGTDLFGRELLDYTSGIGSTVVKNVAGMEGQGLDVELNSINVRTKSFSWSSHLNLSHSRDKVTAYYLSDMRGSSFISSSPTVSGIEGKPVYSVFSFKWAGLDPATGNPQGFKDGEPSTDYAALLGSTVQLDDLRYHGSAVPTWFGSLGNTLAIGNFSVSARITYKLGYYFRRNSVHYSNLYSNGMMNSDFANRWQQPGDEAFTHIPSMPYPANTSRERFYAGSEVLVERGDHVRFQYVTASYDFNKNTWKRLPFRHLQAYLNVNNLGLLWAANNKGIDPDYYQSKYALPPARSYAIGVRASF